MIAVELERWDVPDQLQKRAAPSRPERLGEPDRAEKFFPPSGRDPSRIPGSGSGSSFDPVIEAGDGDAAGLVMDVARPWRRMRIGLAGPHRRNGPNAGRDWRPCGDFLADQGHAARQRWRVFPVHMPVSLDQRRKSACELVALALDEGLQRAGEAGYLLALEQGW